MRYIYGILLSLAFFSCQTNYQFINVSDELNRVLEGRKKISELSFGYEMMPYLDTGFYEIISQFEGFDFEINPRENLLLIVDLPYDSLKLKNEYSSVQDVILNSKFFHQTINPEKLDFDDSIPVASNRALCWVGNDCFVFEFLEPDIIGSVVVTSRFVDGFPKSLIKKWDRKMNRAEEKSQKR